MPGRASPGSEGGPPDWTAPIGLLRLLHMSERGRNIAVGVTALVGVVGLAFMLVLFGEVPALMETGYVVRVDMASANGLSEGSRVRMAGIDIGRVTGVGFQAPPKTGVLITALVREEYRVPVGARVSAQAPLLGGSPALAIDLSRVDMSKPLEYLPTDGSASLAGESLTLASQLAGELQSALQGPVRSLDEIAREFAALSREWTRVGANVNQLIGQRSPEDVDAGRAEGNLASVLSRTDARLRELEAVMKSARQWIDDPQLREDIKATAANARALTESLNKGVDRVVGTVEGAGEDWNKLSRRYMAVADDLSKAIGDLDKSLAALSEGKGAAGKFVTDPALYDNLNDAAARLSKLLDEARQILEKAKKEGLPVKF